MRHPLPFILMALFCATVAQNAFSQSDTTASKITLKDSTANPLPGVKHRMSLQLEAGSQGVGADFKIGITQRLNARLGANFAPVNANTNIAIDGFKTESSQNIDFANAHLWLDVEPFGHAAGLRLVGGAGYFFKAKGKLVMTPTGDYAFSSYKLTGADLGTLTMDLTWKGIAPYVGIGLFRSYPSKFFNINLDLGTYYLTAPSTAIVGTKLLVDNNKLEPQFNENLKTYRWLPVLQLNFNFRIY